MVGRRQATRLLRYGRRIYFCSAPFCGTGHLTDRLHGRGHGRPSGAHFNPNLKVSPQFLSADRIGYLIKGPGQKGELAFTTGEHGADAPAPGVIRNPAWSPDGKQLVYEKFAYDSKQNQPLYGKDQSFELRYTGEFPAISSTGKLANSPFGDVGALRITPFDQIAVYVSDVDGTNRKQLFQARRGQLSHRCGRRMGSGLFSDTGQFSSIAKPSHRS